MVGDPTLVLGVLYPNGHSTCHPGAALGEGTAGVLYENRSVGDDTAGRVGTGVGEVGLLISRGHGMWRDSDKAGQPFVGNTHKRHRAVSYFSGLSLENVPGHAGRSLCYHVSP